MREQTEKTFQKAFGALPASSCDMTEEQKAKVQTLVYVYLSAADLVLQLAYIIQAKHVQTELAGSTVGHLNYIRDKAGLRETDPRWRSFFHLREGMLKESKPLPTEMVKQAAQQINHVLDLIKPLEPLIDSVIRYTTKLALANLQAESLYEAIDDVHFARALAVDLDLDA